MIKWASTSPIPDEAPVMRTTFPAMFSLKKRPNMENMSLKMMRRGSIKGIKARTRGVMIKFRHS